MRIIVATTLLSSLFTFYAFSQQTTTTLVQNQLKAENSDSTGLLIDKKTDFDWDEQTQKWQFAYQSEYVYNDNNDVTVYTGFTRDINNVRVNDYKEEYQYVSGHKLSALIRSNWDTNSKAWLLSEKKAYLYDNVFNLLQAEYFYWDIDKNQWLADSKEIFTYGVNDSLTNWTLYQFIGGLYIEKVRESYTLDQSGNLLESLRIEMDTLNQEWINVKRDIFTYSGDKVTTWTGEVWDTINKNWEGTYLSRYSYDEFGNDTSLVTYQLVGETSTPISKINNTYEESLLINSNKQVWDVSSQSWNTTDSYSIEYNDFGNKVKEVESGWDTNLAAWTNFKTIEYTYDGNQTLQTQKYLLYDVNLKQWVSSYYSAFYYTEVASVETNYENIAFDVEVFPNPVTSELNIVAENASIATLTIYDVSGHSIFSIEFSLAINIAVNSWSEGLYYYQIYNSSNIFTGSFIKE